MGKDHHNDKYEGGELKDKGQEKPARRRFNTRAEKGTGRKKKDNGRDKTGKRRSQL